MTLAYLTNRDAWNLAQGYRSRLQPILATFPRKRTHASLESLNRAIRALERRK